MPDEQKKKARRLNRVRKGVWVRAMSEEEWGLYVASCNELGLTKKPRGGGRNPPDYQGRDMPKKPNLMEPTTDAEGNVVQMFAKDRVSVPEGGAASSDGDHRTTSKLNLTAGLGKRWTEIYRAVQAKEYSWDDFVASLTPEELARGQLMDKDGGFTGRPPNFVPRAFHDACIRELLGRGKELYKANYIKAIEAMTGIAESKTAKESDRIKAAQFVIERLEGKVPDRLEVSVSDPWQQIISGIVAEADDEMIGNAQEYLSRVRPEGNEG